MRELNERETARILPIVKSDDDLKAGDKCPRDGCRGILKDEPLIVFNPAHPTEQLKAFHSLICDYTEKRGRLRCDFRYTPKGISEQIDKWRAEAKTAEAEA